METLHSQLHFRGKGSFIEGEQKLICIHAFARGNICTEGTAWPGSFDISQQRLTIANASVRFVTLSDHFCTGKRLWIRGFNFFLSARDRRQLWRDSSYLAFPPRVFQHFCSLHRRNSVTAALSSVEKDESYKQSERLFSSNQTTLAKIFATTNP